MDAGGTTSFLFDSADRAARLQDNAVASAWQVEQVPAIVLAPATCQLPAQALRFGLAPHGHVLPALLDWFRSAGACPLEGVISPDVFQPTHSTDTKMPMKSQPTLSATLSLQSSHVS